MVPLRCRTAWFLILLFFAGIVETAHTQTGIGWVQCKPAKKPSARMSHAITYDPVNRKTLLFGGTTGPGFLDETWTWDGRVWVLLSPPIRPGSRVLHALASDTSRRRVVCFGGVRSSGRHGDTWVWDGKTWARRNPSRSPSPRYGHAMAFDSMRRVVVLFGGNDGKAIGGGTVDDTWLWDGSLWHQARPPKKPSPS